MNKMKTRQILAQIVAVCLVLGTWYNPAMAAFSGGGGSHSRIGTTFATPSGATPSESTPSEATPPEATPSESTPSEATPSESTPSEATPSEPTGTGEIIVVTGVTPGNLRAEIENHPDFVSAASIRELTISGSLDGSDFRYIRYYLYQLTMLDLDGIDNTELPSYALSNCYRLTEVILPTHMNRIGDSAFDGCEQLREVDLSYITSLGDYSFYDCYNLTLAPGTNLSSGLNHIPYAAFAYCYNLREVDLSHVDSLERGAFFNCTRMTLAPGTNLSADLREIPGSTFEGCEQLSGVDLSHVTSLGNYAFYGCSSLTLVSGTNLSPDLRYIPFAAFAYCSSLSALDLSHIEVVNIYAFYNCTNLKAIALPSVKPLIGVGAFDNVPSLLLLVEGGVTYDSLDGFPSGSAYPFLSGILTSGGTLTLAVSPYGGDGVSYQWYFNQSLLQGETRRTLTIFNAKKSNAGSYECEIRIGTISQRISKTVIFSSDNSLGSIGSGGSGGGGSTKAMNTGSWQRDSVGWWYQYKDGTYPKSEWKKINDEWYYFEASGYMKINWLLDAGKWYWLDPETGKMLKSCWMNDQNSWYYLGDDGAMITGWLEYKDSFYYLSEIEDGYYGHMLKNTKTPDGYLVNEDGVRMP